MNRTLIRLSLAIALAGFPPLAVGSAYAQASASQNRGTAGQTNKHVSKDQDAANSRLLAAAEPFEALTEQAFSATPAQLDQLVRQVETAAHQVSGMLSPNARSALSKRLAEIRQARKANHPSDVALASVEGYRILVSATHRTKVPTAVSLLDYAGFRYDADLKSKPIRWTDMQRAVHFGQQQWKSLSGKITDASLRNDFARAIEQMSHAVESKSAKAARQSVTTELALVDKLETYFSRK